MNYSTEKPRVRETTEMINDMRDGKNNDDMGNTKRWTECKRANKTVGMQAEKGDVILVAGKGHENYQDVKGVKHHFDDKEILQEIFSLNS